ncbi:MAG: GMC family oxidoreductase [Acidobacteria bacterium]|nr:GMC family oxidoreductase [Acidobacteriota bacterium]MBI3657080.1 GMC family oxidoreductase [Acidobacteriota bacterium]
MYDAIVVGSGATGGWAAKELTEKGMEVLLLEAGRRLDPAKDFADHKRPYELEFRGKGKFFQKTRPVQSKCYACTEYNYSFFVDDLQNPYVTLNDQPFDWIRMRVVGGRTLSWGRQSYRLSDLDFKAAGRDGYGDNWPISYADLEPYYDKVELFIGISGQTENLPHLPDSKFLPPMPLTCGEQLLRKAAKAKFGRTVTIGRAAVLTKHHNGRFACHYCGPCEHGCITNSYFSSPLTTVAAAQKTGRLTLQPNSVVSHIVVDNRGKAKGVAYVDQTSRAAHAASGKVVLLCASTLESTRILLNSSSSKYPNGLGNSSGVLGHYLMDHIMWGGARGRLPVLGKASPHWGPPRRPNGLYIPRFRNVSDKFPKFLRGYGFQGGSGQNFNFGATGFGADYKRKVKEEAYWSISLGGFGECLARWDNFVELDKDRKDAWGIPVLKIHCAYGKNEKAMVLDMADTAAEMIEAAGGTEIARRTAHNTPGLAIHEVGTARMGNDPKTSVLNRFNQVHDVKNVFVTDGSCYVSSPCQNPTLTMMAITVRACDYLVEEARAGRL